MKKLKVLLGALLSMALLAVCPTAHESVIWTITSGASTSSIQSTISGASPGDVVQFNAATYSITGQITLKCGVTYTATIPAATPNVILSSTMGISGAIFNLFPGSWFANPCTQTTTIQYFNFANSGGIAVETSFTNLTIVHNQFTNLPCCGTFPQPGTVGISFKGSQQSSNTAQALNNVDIEWNIIGDSASCTSPTNGMTSFASPETIQGNCGGLRFDTTINGPVKVWNNVFLHLGESIALGCPGGGDPGRGSAPCEPVNNGVTTHNLSVRYNDFNQIHRIPFEEQPETTSGVDFQFNSEHDGFMPYFGSFGLSLACCTNGATAPYLNVSNNVIAMNSAPHVRWGYGIEAGGKGATYLNNWLGVNGASSIGLSYSYGLPPWSISNNTVCGSGFASAGYIADEGQHSTPPTQTGNATSSTCSAVTSVAPTLPASGFLIGPITVTDAGYTSGPQPLGNTSIYCTTDGSTPTVSSPLYTGPLAVVYPVTLKCIGMWGTGANTKTYPSGYGFVPSAVVSASYTSAAAAATPVLTPGSTSFATSLGVSISDATPGATIYYTTDGTVPTTSSTVYSGPITVTGATTIVKAIAIKAGNSQSATATGTYISTTVVSTPTFSPASSSFSPSVVVSISDLTPSSTIYYTTDGSTPGTTGGGGGGATYYISPSGSDSNAGTSSGSPWLSPNHAVNCGDTILAAAGAYAPANFASGKWGTVTCSAGNNVAWLKCATFDSCKINQTGSAQGLYVTASYWGVQGWEVTASGTFGTCFNVQTAINHVIFANDIANGCMNGGFSMIGSDYDVMVGNIAYNTAQGSAACTSGFNIFEPAHSDTVAGTHMYVAGNFGWANVNPSSCASTAATDGEGLIFDTFNHEPYTQQSVAENNIFVGNGGRGIEVNNNTAGTFFLKNNTTYGNNTQSGQLFPSDLGELTVDAGNVTVTGNLAMTSAGTVGGHAIYAASLQGGSGPFSGNWLYSAAGNNTFGSGYGSNATGTDPVFAAPTIPGAPSCGSFANVPACMASVISNFTPGAGASAYGYHVPSSTPIANPYFPPWLCNTNLPSGLVSMPCGQVYTGPITVTSSTTVKAVATASGLTTSSIGSASYTLSGGGGPGVTAAPAASPGAGAYFATQSVTLSDTTAGSTICYTTDGSTPAGISGICSAGTTYSGAISVSSSETINAIGTKTGLTNSSVASFAYVISAPTPTERGNIDYTQIKSLERLGPGNMFQMVNVGTYSAVNTATPCNSTNQGATAFVLDSTTATYGAAISGAGSSKVHALCNGTAWVVD